MRDRQLTIVALLVALVTAGAAVTAHKDVGSSGPQAVSPARSPVRRTEGGLGEGIVVHGHWTMVVRDSNGAVRSRAEFENALDPVEGAKLLVQTIAHQASPGAWYVVLGATSAGQPCLSANGTNQPVPCGIIEPNAPTAKSGSRTLALTVSADGKTLSLAGSVVAQRAAAIDGVGTQLDSCPPTFAPGSAPATTCSSGIIVWFTRATLATPVNVVAGQTIQVTVAISFS